MKNKKLLKTVLCITSGIGFATSIPFTTTACGSSKPIPVDKKILPYEVYDINETTGVLNGFKSGIDLSQYDGICDTMQIPASVTSIGDNAFNNKIPSFIKNLTFADGSNCSSINSVSFYDALQLTSVTFPSSLEKIDAGSFGNCRSLNYIAWDLPVQYENNINIDTNAFDEYFLPKKGTVKSLNRSIASSEQLLTWIQMKTTADFSEWTPA